MANKQYSTDMLQAGDTFIVRGRTSYPRLTHVLEGEELQEEIKRATQQGRIPTTTPHSYTTLVDATIEFANPQAPTLAECYAAERLYINKDGKTCYTAVRKSQTLAEYGVVDPTDYTKVQGIYLDPNKTLANGLDVKCYFRVFDTKAGMHKGISLDAIVFQEPVKYYEFSNADSQLAARGLTWAPPVGEAPEYTPNAAQAAPQSAPAYGAPAPAYGAPAPAYGSPAPAPAYGAPMPTPQPAAAPAPAPAYGAPAYNSPAPQAAPAPAPTYGAPMPAPQPAAAPAPAPYTPNVGAQQGQADPYAGNAPQPVQQPAPAPAPQQTIGNAGGTSAFDGAYQY